MTLCFLTLCALVGSEKVFSDIHTVELHVFLSESCGMQFCHIVTECQRKFSKKFPIITAPSTSIYTLINKIRNNGSLTDKKRC